MLLFVGFATHWQPSTKKVGFARKKLLGPQMNKVFVSD